MPNVKCEPLSPGWERFASLKIIRATTLEDYVINMIIDLYEQNDKLAPPAWMARQLVYEDEIFQEKFHNLWDMYEGDEKLIIAKLENFIKRTVYKKLLNK